ncbi:hypothetical protein DNHGIG_25970 [Collibacillus ludicampi]|uniref:Putative tail fiber protein gp53-like C-terminal domain-containing protein n=1 Tax=Collibacillus ludicampi TaxID=2771369 RepID=A0AAV4LH15_9BACL|nr:hypothetical protein [Collibacillus ludicampi]GIM47048.1 hypothetical protein DNHGIG_25970 [Collibacillus ludicampi]
MTLSITFYDNIKYHRQDFMNRDLDFFGNGVVALTDFPLTFPATPNMTVNIGQGRAWVDGYRIANDSNPVTLTVPAADSTYPRIDIIQIGHDDINQTYSLVVKKGVAAASPIEPGADPGYIKLYAINVPANATQITAANIIDRRSLVPLNVSGSQIQYSGVAGVNQANTFAANQTLAATGQATSQQNYPSYEMGFTRSFWNGSTHVEKTSFLQVDQNGKLNFINESASSVLTVDQSGSIQISGQLILGGTNSISNPNAPVYLAPPNPLGMGMDQYGNLLPINPGAVTVGTTWSVFGKNGNKDFSVAVDGSHKVSTFKNVIDDGQGNATFAGVISDALNPMRGFRNLLETGKQSFSRATNATRKNLDPVGINVLRTEQGRFGQGAFIEEPGSNLVYNSDFETFTGTQVVFSDSLTSYSGSSVPAPWTLQSGSFTFSASGATSGANGSWMTAGNSAWKPLTGSGGQNLALTVQATFTTPSSLNGFLNLELVQNTGAVSRYYAEIAMSSKNFYIAKQVNGGAPSAISSLVNIASLAASSTYTITFSIDINGNLTAKIYSGVGTGGTLLGTATVTDTSLTGGFMIGVYGDSGVVVKNAQVMAPFPDGWYINTAGDSRVAWALTQNPISGSYSLSAVGLSGVVGSCYKNVSGLSASTVYTASGFISSSNTGSKGSLIEIDWFNGSTYLSNAVSSYVNGNTVTPVRGVVTATSPSNANNANVLCSVQDAGTYVFDAIQFEQKGYPTTYIRNDSTSQTATRNADSLWYTLSQPLPSRWFGALVWKPEYPNTSGAMADATLISATDKNVTGIRYLLHFVNFAASGDTANVFKFSKTDSQGNNIKVVSDPFTFNAGDTIFAAVLDDPVSGYLYLWVGINGGPLKQYSVASTIQITDAQRVYVGCRSDSPNSLMANGTIDFPIVSDTIPTPAQVQALYQASDWGGMRNWPGTANTLVSSAPNGIFTDAYGNIRAKPNSKGTSWSVVDALGNSRFIVYTGIDGTTVSPQIDGHNIAQVLSGGYKIQSGRASIPSGSNNTSVTFPTPFSSGTIPIVVLINESGSWLYQTVLNGQPSNTGFGVYTNTTANTVVFDWIAIGT